MKPIDTASLFDGAGEAFLEENNRQQLAIMPAPVIFFRPSFSPARQRM